MLRPWFAPTLGLAAALLAAAGLTFVLARDAPSPARRAVLALPGHRAYPDCQPAAERLDHQVLACWEYGRMGAWRIDAFDSAHRALVVHAGVTGGPVIDEAADWLIRLANGRYDEVLLYATVLEPPAPSFLRTTNVTVTRVRWTADGGFERLTFDVPRGEERGRD